MTPSHSDDPSGPRERLLEAALRLLADAGPEALQARKVAAEVGASTMAVYTHFGGMPQLRVELARAGFVRFTAQLDVPATADPVADLLAMGMAYREFARANPRLYRLMFAVNADAGTDPADRAAPGGSVLDLPDAELSPESVAAYGRLVDAVRRAMAAGRLREDDPALVAGQVWSSIHGFVLLDQAGFFGAEDHGLGHVLAPLTTNLLVGLGDTREAVDRSLTTLIESLAPPGDPSHR